MSSSFFFFQAEDGIRDVAVTGVQTCALPISSSNAVILVFKIDEGPKVKVGKIKFTGNHHFSDRKLIRAMRHDRPYAIPLYFWYIPVLSKTYDREKLSEDLEVGIRGLYRDNGYFKVSVGEPLLENVDTTHARLGVPVVTGKGHGKAVNITIAIEEGERFHKIGRASCRERV